MTDPTCVQMADIQRGGVEFIDTCEHSHSSTTPLSVLTEFSEATYKALSRHTIIASR